MNVNFESIEKAWFKPKKTVLDELEEWLNDLIDKNNDTYELYKDDILHHDHEISNARYQNNIFLAILDKIQELKKENENG